MFSLGENLTEEIISKLDPESLIEVPQIKKVKKGLPVIEKEIMFTYIITEQSSICLVHNVQKLFKPEMCPKYGQYLLGKIEVLGLNNFGDSSVNLKFRIKTVPNQQWSVMREFNRLIKNKFDEVNIEIPFPQRTIHVEKTE